MDEEALTGMGRDGHRVGGAGQTVQDNVSAGLLGDNRCEKVHLGEGAFGKVYRAGGLAFKTFKDTEEYSKQELWRMEVTCNRLAIKALLPDVVSKYTVLINEKCYAQELKAAEEKCSPLPLPKKGEPYILSRTGDNWAFALSNTSELSNRSPDLPLMGVKAMVHVANALRAEKCYHNDYKPDNLFAFDINGHPTVRVGDFGLLQRWWTANGTPLYMAFNTDFLGHTIADESLRKHYRTIQNALRTLRHSFKISHAGKELWIIRSMWFRNKFTVITTTMELCANCGDQATSDRLQQFIEIETCKLANKDEGTLHDPMPGFNPAFNPPFEPPPPFFARVKEVLSRIFKRLAAQRASTHAQQGGAVRGDALLLRLRQLLKEFQVLVLSLLFERGWGLDDLLRVEMTADVDVTQAVKVVGDFLPPVTKPDDPRVLRGVGQLPVGMKERDPLVRRKVGGPYRGSDIFNDPRVLRGVGQLPVRSRKVGGPYRGSDIFNDPRVLHIRGVGQLPPLKHAPHRNADAAKEYVYNEALSRAYSGGSARPVWVAALAVALASAVAAVL